jgi:hypothetical protein
MKPREQKGLSQGHRAEPLAVFFWPLFHCGKMTGQVAGTAGILPGIVTSTCIAAPIQRGGNGGPGLRLLPQSTADVALELISF